MAVIDRIRRRGDRGKQVLTGPAELQGPSSNSQRQGFAAATRITGPVDVYEITDGTGSNAGAYTVTVRPYSEAGFRASHGGVGRVAVVKQLDGTTTPGNAASLLGLRKPASRERPVTLGPFTLTTADRLFVVVERTDTATLKYQLEVDDAP